MRSAFITDVYPALKSKNPDLPVLIREASGTPPRAFVRLGACAFAPTAQAMIRIVSG